MAVVWAITAAIVAIGVGEIVAAYPAPRSAPLSAVGEAVIGATPDTVVEWAKQTFGTADKMVLQLGTVLLLTVVAATVGIVARRRPMVAAAAVVVFTGIGAAAAITRPDATPIWLLPSLAAGAAAGLVGAVLPRWALRDARDDEPDHDPRVTQRRRFLTGGLVLAGAAATGGLVARGLSQSLAVSRARSRITLPAPADPAVALPTNTDLKVPGLSTWRTRNADFYRIDTALTTPSIDPDTYRLRIFGRVGRELELSYRDLLARPLRERDITLTCVSNQVGGPLVGNARWLGVPLADLLDEVEPDPSADQLVGRSVDGFTAGAPTALCRDGRDALLAVGMNGAPLPIEHGFPVRMIVPGLYGYVSATKWLTELELTSFADFDAYWVPRGWSAEGPIKTESRIDTPHDHSRARAGRVPVAGVAWAQHRGVAAVEVRVDGGAWHPATLSEVPSDDTWRQWVWYWDAEPGDHLIQVRATDGAGDTQIETPSPVAPNGATGWHRISVSVE